MQAWAKLHADILNAVDKGSRHKAHAALSAFQAFAAEHIGAPHPGALSDTYQPVHRAPRANVVWPSEIAWVREQLAELPDSRFHLQLRVVFELLLSTGVRTGELVTVAVENLRLYGGGKLLLVLDPRPLDDKLKTVTARRSFLIEDRTCIDLVDRWVARRILEQAKPHELCFGDPYDFRGVWRQTETQATIGRYLKAASGDRQLSPHSLRHNLVTLTALSAKSDTDPERLLHALSASVGHESTATTLDDYYHLADQQVWSALHRAAARLEVTQRAASEWLGCRQDRFRKRVSRCSLGSSDYITQVLEQASSTVPIRDVCEDFEIGARRSPHVPKTSPQQVPFFTVLHVCKDLHAGLPCTAVAARSDINPLEIRKIASCISDRAGLSVSWALSDAQLGFRVDEAFKRLSSFADFTRLDQPSMHHLAELASRTQRATELEQASLSWEVIRVGSYLSLERPSSAFDLLKFLARAQVSVKQLVLRVARRSNDDDREVRRLERTAAARLADVFLAPPRIEHCKERRGRPRAYLLIGPAEGIEQPSSAALGLGGLHALMLTACVWRAVKGESCR